MRDHPVIERMERYGELEPEVWGYDHFGDIIIEGEDIVEYDGVTLLKSNLEHYLAEEMGFTFKTAL